MHSRGPVLARACEGATSTRSLWPIALASLLVPIALVQDVYQITNQRQRQREAIDDLAATNRFPTWQFFFADGPGLNRVYGRPELVYDGWLYPVFESMHLAQPRSTWLPLALNSRQIRFIFSKSYSPEIEGIGPQQLRALGFAQVGRLGEFFVWERYRIPKIPNPKS